MVATRWPAFIRATAICKAVVHFPEPPFSLPSTTTCAEPDWPWLVCTNMFDPCRYLQITRDRGQAKCAITPADRWLCALMVNPDARRGGVRDRPHAWRAL